MKSLLKLAALLPLLLAGLLSGCSRGDCAYYGAPSCYVAQPCYGGARWWWSAPRWAYTGGYYSPGWYGRGWGFHGGAGPYRIGYAHGFRR